MEPAACSIENRLELRRTTVQGTYHETTASQANLVQEKSRRESRYSKSDSPRHILRRRGFQAWCNLAVDISTRILYSLVVCHWDYKSSQMVAFEVFSNDIDLWEEGHTVRSENVWQEARLFLPEIELSLRCRLGRRLEGHSSQSYKHSKRCPWEMRKRGKGRNSTGNWNVHAEEFIYLENRQEPVMC